MAFSPKGSLSEKNKSVNESKEKPKQATDLQTPVVFRANPKPKVQDDFRNLLLEFVISSLLDQPSDVVDYAADYFVNLKEQRHTLMIKNFDQPAKSRAAQNMSKDHVKDDDSQRKIDADFSEKSKTNGEFNKLDRPSSMEQYG